MNSPETVAVLIPIFGILMIISVVVFPIWIRAHYGSLARQRLHETVRIMVEKGQPVSPEMLASLGSSSSSAGSSDPFERPGPSKDLRVGVILMGVGVGLLVLGVALGPVSDWAATGPVAGSAAIPGLIGVGFVVLSIINRRNSNNSGGPVG